MLGHPLRNGETPCCWMGESFGRPDVELHEWADVVLQHVDNPIGVIHHVVGIDLDHLEDVLGERDAEQRGAGGLLCVHDERELRVDEPLELSLEPPEIGSL